MTILPFRDPNGPWDPTQPTPKPAPGFEEDPAGAERWWRQYREWSRERKKLDAKARSAERDKLVHRNWDSRMPGCVVPVPLPPHSIHHSVWEGQVRACNARSVAWDGTDPRAVGYMYGACRAHLAQALVDDPSRSWLWADGRPVDRSTIEDELTLLALVGSRR